MKNRIAKLMAMVVASVALVAAQDTSAPPAKSEANPVMDAMASIGALIAGEETPAAATTAAVESEETAGQQPASDGEPAVTPKQRTMKNSMILITAGAAAGAALGKTMGKDSKATIIGAALGGAAGLIYDRMTYKNPGKI